LAKSFFDAPGKVFNLRKRDLIETVNDELKNICRIEHARHRYFVNFISYTVSALIAYRFLSKKPSLNPDISDSV
jgi:hypothetical protein